MIIAVSGAQNTGKSTFIKDLKAVFGEFMAVPKMDYRTLISDNNLKINREGNFKNQSLIFDSFVKQLVELHGNREENKKLIVFDRCILDAYVYTNWLFLGKDDFDGTAEDMLNMRYKLNKYQKLVDLNVLITCEDEIKLVADGVRDTDPNYQMSIDADFRTTSIELTIQEKARFLRVNGNRDERVAQFITGAMLQK